jgi:peptidoglycan/xylan/chitin deacetylase (PgdA/CDA1 family)
MRGIAVGGAVLASLIVCPAFAGDCPGNPDAMGVERTIVIDPAEMPRLGGHQYDQKLNLQPKEFILTLDDGPVKPQTVKALDFLKKECAKATFFLIGENAKEHPELVRRIAEEGHTIGTHTQTHAYLSRVSIERAKQEIDGGFRSAQAALDPIGMKVSPFFRYPGLMSTPETEAYLRSHGIVTVGIDVLASDWFSRLQHNPEGILDRAVSRLEKQGSGILLLHDVKRVTVGLLPELFKRLKARGFKLVHMVPKDGALPVIPPAPEVDLTAEKKPARARHASRHRRVTHVRHRRQTHRHAHGHRPRHNTISAIGDFPENR